MKHCNNPVIKLTGKYYKLVIKINIQITSVDHLYPCTAHLLSHSMLRDSPLPH